MQSPGVLRAAALLLLASVLLGCAGTGTRTGRGPDGLLTWTSQNAACGVTDAYPAGTLEGSADNPDRVWLLAPGGRRVYLIWPHGFTVRFEPDAVLYSSSGVIVARAGDAININLEVPEQGGTPDDPMLVTWVNGTCYAPTPL